MARVFIVMDSPRFNTDSADVFGKRVFLFNEDLKDNPFNVNGFSNEVGRKLTEANYNPEDDYIAVTGSAVQVALLLAVVAGNYFDYYDSIGLLIFDARTSEYRPVRLSVEKSIMDYLDTLHDSYEEERETHNEQIQTNA